MVPEDGLTVTHAALPEAVQGRPTNEFLLNVTVCAGGVGLSVDAEYESVVGATGNAKVSEATAPVRSMAATIK